MIGTTELIVIGGAVLLLFGGKKIPELMRSLGRGVSEYKRGLNGEETTNENSTQENKENTIADTENNSAKDEKTKAE
ncbi:MAG: twin-arginine translocase TatA/TatE family subunit [Bacteroidales bacterium]|nr:twin-arginine translocase TatA/TatE family subunit [Bacteroidales bacterium]